MVNVGVELKFAVAFAPFTVIAWFGGVKAKPLFVGVTVYEPFSTPVKVYTPDVLAVTVAVAAPVNFTVAPDPPVPPIVPVMVKVGAELKFAVVFAPFTVIAWFGGVKTNPLLVAVTVYDPLTTEKL
jgi:hypothetical protein